MNKFSQILRGDSSPDSEIPTALVNRRRHPCDPRPDLEDPDNLWHTVLPTAYGVYGDDGEIYWFLQGLRILGCGLSVRPDGRLHLDYTPALESWDKHTLLDQWLKPQTQAIKDVFSRTEGLLRGLDPGKRLPSWARKAV